MSVGDTGSYMPRMAARAKEILDAYRDYESAEEAARQASGYYDAKAQYDAAYADEMALRREIVEERAQTVAGLHAKLKAVAEPLGRETLDAGTALEDGKIPSYDRLVLCVLRDGAAILG